MYSIAGVEIKWPIINASGCHCTQEDHLVELDQSMSGAVISKTCTMNSRVGNPFPRYFDNELGSINSTGLANKGYEFYKQMSTQISKTYILSVSTLNIDDTYRIVKDYAKFNPDSLVEINVSCPNIPGEPQLGYEMERLEEFISKVCKLKKDLKVGFKLPPYLDTSHIDKVAEILKRYPVSFITCINSLGNGLILDEDFKPVIKPKNGLGGIGGEYCKPIGLSNVYQFSKLLGDRMDIIGCGGVKSGRDVMEYIKCGATAVQVGTQLVKEGPDVFERILNEYTELLTIEATSDDAKVDDTSK